jgi:hypothetical protein
MPQPSNSFSMSKSWEHSHPEHCKTNCAKGKESLPDQNLTQRSGHLLVNVLLSSRQLNVHVAVDADETAFVFGLAPLQAYNNFLVDTILRFC